MNNKSKTNKKFVKRKVDDGPWYWLFSESMPPETYEKIFKEVNQMLESNKPPKLNYENNEENSITNQT